MATKTTRRRPDQITSPKEYGDPIADGIHHAIKPVDEIATRMELKWGCDRLPGLVSPETAAKFGSAKAKLDAAILDNDPQAVAKKAQVMVKGYKALDKEASNDHEPFKPRIWHYTTQAGFKFAIAKGNADAIKAIRSDQRMEGVAVYSLDEIGRLLESDSMALVNAIKEQFPDSNVTAIRPAKNDSLDDPLPF